MATVTSRLGAGQEHTRSPPCPTAPGTAATRTRQEHARSPGHERCVRWGRGRSHGGHRPRDRPRGSSYGRPRFRGNGAILHQLIPTKLWASLPAVAYSPHKGAREAETGLKGDRAESLGERAGPSTRPPTERRSRDTTDPGVPTQAGADCPTYGPWGQMDPFSILRKDSLADGREPGLPHRETETSPQPHAPGTRPTRGRSQP